MKHKWLLSEKLGRDVGFRIACIDFVENVEQALDEYMSYKRAEILNEMGAQTISREIWDTISDSQPPKQLVKRRIILPLMEDNNIMRFWNPVTADEPTALNSWDGVGREVEIAYGTLGQTQDGNYCGGNWNTGGSTLMATRFAFGTIGAASAALSIAPIVQNYRNMRVM